MLKDDHKSVKQLFRAFTKTQDGQRGERRRRADEITTEHTRHAFIEEQVFYPAVRKDVPDAEDTVLESLEEHHIVKWVCAEIEAMDAGDERFYPKVVVLTESVKHHIEEEESELFPTVRSALGRRRLAELGEQLAKAKSKAPTTPQPEPA
jgi:hemerythrin-like domain-containing protein